MGHSTGRTLTTVICFDERSHWDHHPFFFFLLLGVFSSGGVDRKKLIAVVMVLPKMGNPSGTVLPSDELSPQYRHRRHFLFFSTSHPLIFPLIDL